jgi:hypothetical protein
MAWAKYGGQEKTESSYTRTDHEDASGDRGSSVPEQEPEGLLVHGWGDTLRERAASSKRIPHRGAFFLVPRLRVGMPGLEALPPFP